MRSEQFETLNLPARCGGKLGIYVMAMFDDLFDSGYGEKQIEGMDYTMNPDGYRVMSEFYLVKRGYCCSNGCKNCPYSPKAVKGNRTLREDVVNKYNLP